MLNLERERQLARETQARLRRLERQREEAERAEERVPKPQKQNQPPKRTPGAPRPQKQKKAQGDNLKRDFDHYLRLVQQATGQVSMDLSYL